MTTYYGPYSYVDLEPLARALRDVCELADLDYTRGLYVDSACPGVTAGELGDRLADLDELIQAATRASDELHRIMRGEENSDKSTYCDICRSTSPCNHLNRRAYVPTADPYGDAVCNCSNPYCQV